MPMKGISVLEQRLSFVLAVRNGESSISKACRDFGISRPTGYALLKRYDECGQPGLADRSKAPLNSPSAVPDAIADRIVALKREKPYALWGPKKLRARLVHLHPETQWPAVSTFGRILDSAGEVRRVYHRPKPPRLGELTQAAQANDVWCVDFKGQFPLRNGALCFPLTLTDNERRFLLRCRALPNTGGDAAWAILVDAFREYGMPLVVRSDNGTPFSSASVTGLSRIAVRLIKLGIMPERIDPGCPQQNGRHERMHRTLKAEATQPPASSMRAQQRLFDAWLRVYNEERPHEALGMQTPSSVYDSSPRIFPERIPAFEYDQSMRTHKVRPNGSIRWRGGEVYVSDTLAGDTIGVEPIDDGHSAVYAGFLPVAVLDLANGRLLRGNHAVPYLKDLWTKARETALNGRPSPP